ncbi:MAG: hypothetical protein NTY80_01760 [candidate division SR1 bacterium]|nr:hypothetical protein [candidate division SR1 bacterium]
MELFQVLHKNIPQRNKVFALFRKQEQQDISKPLLYIIKKVKNNIKDSRMINSFCIEVHDLLYYYVAFNKIRVAKKILRLIEKLALPIRYLGYARRKEILKKTCKMKL